MNYQLMIILLGTCLCSMLGGSVREMTLNIQLLVLECWQNTVSGGLAGIACTFFFYPSGKGAYYRHNALEVFHIVFCLNVVLILIFEGPILCNILYQCFLTMYLYPVGELRRNEKTLTLTYLLHFSGSLTNNLFIFTNYQTT